MIDSVKKPSTRIIITGKIYLKADKLSNNSKTRLKYQFHIYDVIFYKWNNNSKSSLFLFNKNTHTHTQGFWMCRCMQESVRGSGWEGVRERMRVREGGRKREKARVRENESEGEENRDENLWVYLCDVSHYFGK